MTLSRESDNAHSLRPRYGGNISGTPPFAGSGGSGIATLGVTAATYHEFETILKGVQMAWGHADTTLLCHHARPEILSYFAQNQGGRWLLAAIQQV